jgi:hypothetical protein
MVVPVGLTVHPRIVMRWGPGSVPTVPYAPFPITGAGISGTWYDRAVARPLGWRTRSRGG